MKVNGVHLNDAGKAIDRFDLEQAIMSAWHTSDDLKSLYKSLERMDEDQVMSALDGLQIFADMRFEELWDTFEKCIQNGMLDTKRTDSNLDDMITLTDLDTGYSLDISTDNVTFSHDDEYSTIRIP